ncbi:MAG: UDP-glucose/GDP-mannose dehydrogenase family protein [Alphaproteobacteria bacterium]
MTQSAAPARIVVVGAGYVGLVSGACLASLGHRVIVVDRDQNRVDAVNAGASPLHEPGLTEMLQSLRRDGRLTAGTDLAGAVAAADLAIIAVGTPGDGDRIDLRQVEGAAREIGAAIANRTDRFTIIVKSTVVPGTTDTVVRAAIEDGSGKAAGDFGLAMNPEFLREGSAVADFMDPDRIVVGGWDNASVDAVMGLYDGFTCPKLRTNLRNAELIKYASNSLLATMVSFSNEIAGLCEAMPGTDVDVVMSGVHHDRRLMPIVDGKPVRPGILSYLMAGAGFGGSCLPKDVNALRMFARGIDAPSPLLDAVMTVNQARPERVLDLLSKALGGLAGRKVALLGLAFKPDTDDLRDSPALATLQRLREAGADVRAYDPIVSKLAPASVTDLCRTCLDAAEALEAADAAVIATAWPEFAALDWTALAPRMAQAIVVDGRNLLSGTTLPKTLTYLPIGQAIEPGTEGAAA